MALIIEKIIKIQNELKAPKSQYNNFGKYKYRSQEDILEPLKPLLKREGLMQTITDSVIHTGDRYYIEATVTVTDGDASVSVSGFAREAESKKGMDESQISGTASSYARKYALNGMWLIDDTKDVDAQPPSKPELTPKHKHWQKAAERLSSGEVTIETIRKHYELTELNEDLLIDDAKNITEG